MGKWHLISYDAYPYHAFQLGCGTHENDTHAEQLPGPLKAKRDVLKQQSTTASGFVHSLIEREFAQKVAGYPLQETFGAGDGI